MTLTLAITTWMLLAGGFWAADVIAQLRADLARQRTCNCKREDRHP